MADVALLAWPSRHALVGDGATRALAGTTTVRRIGRARRHVAGADERSVRRAVRTGVARCRLQRRASRRGRRAPRRRAFRHARARTRRDGHRGRSARIPDLRRGRRPGGARARHAVRNGHDHRQRRDRSLRAIRRGAPSRAIVSHRRRRPGLLGLDCARRARAHHAGLHRDRAGPGVYDVAARLRRDLLVLAVVRVRVLPNDSPSRLFPAPGRRRRARACTAADGCNGHAQLRAAARRARGRDRARESDLTYDRSGRGTPSARRAPRSASPSR